MPVTARLSKRFYERLGDDIANELVEWFNAVDATYRADLRELNSANFERFDSRLEQRMAQLESKLEQRMAQLESKLEQRMAQFESKLEQRMAHFESRLDMRISRLDADLRVAFAAGLAELRSSLMTWIVGLWITSALGFAGIILTLLRLK